MTLIAQAIDESLADAMYELLLRTPLHVPLRDGRPFAIAGPGGQIAVPVFLDRAALEHWGGSALASTVHSARDVARIALALPDAWLVVDLGSVPGSQPIARKGVEMIADGSYPGETKTAHVRESVAELYRAVQAGKLTGELLRAAAKLRVFTIGTSVPAADADPDARVVQLASVNLMSVRSADGRSYLPAWPTAGPMFAFQPELPHALTFELGRLIEHALALERGLVVDPHGCPVAIPFAHLASLWRSE